MKLLVVSDTHKKIEKVIEVYGKLRDIDLLLHLGDFVSDAKRLEQALQVPVLAVKGNMDGSTSSADDKVLETPYGKILLTHGHAHQVKHSLLPLHYRAQELDCKAALFGHTHASFCDCIDDIYLVNPGSLSLPRDGTLGSYAVIHALPDQFHVAIVPYAILTPKPAPTPKRALRSLLNNSDRF